MRLNYLLNRKMKITLGTISIIIMKVLRFFQKQNLITKKKLLLIQYL